MAIESAPATKPQQPARLRALAAGRVARSLCALFATSLTLVLAGCGNEARPTTLASDATGSALTSYIAQIEPIRLAVYLLLNRADPIIEASRERHGFSAGATCPSPGVGVS
jgi:hypothetical protein